VPRVANWRQIDSSRRLLRNDLLRLRSSRSAQSSHLEAWWAVDLQKDYLRRILNATSLRKIPLW